MFYHIFYPCAFVWFCWSIVVDYCMVKTVTLGIVLLLPNVKLKAVFKMAVICNIMPCCLGVHWKFKEPCCVHNSSTIIMQMMTTSEMSLQFYQTTQYHIPEDSNLNIHCCENPRSHQNSFLVFMWTCKSIKLITEHLATLFSSSQDGVSGSGYANVYPNISTKENNNNK